MRIFAISDLHVDYEANARWVSTLSTCDHLDDVLIVAGDVCDSLSTLGHTLALLERRFRRVFFVPGNHELWVARDGGGLHSLEKFEAVRKTAQAAGVLMAPTRLDGVTIVPMFSWYDYSFGFPDDELKRIWMDFRACRWPRGMEPPEIAARFASLNRYARNAEDELIISFSHFLPRIDVMPAGISAYGRALFPVLGMRHLETQIRRLGSAIHIYGHSHVNRHVVLDGTLYVNNAFAYPSESHISAKALRCVYDSTRPHAMPAKPHAHGHSD